MIKPTIINILRLPNGIVELKKGFDKALKNIPAVNENLLKIAWKCMKIDHLNKSLMLQEISIVIFFQFFCKINRNQSQIVVETTYGLNPY